jgi:hypothetical protein
MAVTNIGDCGEWETNYLNLKTGKQTDIKAKFDFKLEQALGDGRKLTLGGNGAALKEKDGKVVRFGYGGVQEMEDVERQVIYQNATDSFAILDLDTERTLAEFQNDGSGWKVGKQAYKLHREWAPGPFDLPPHPKDGESCEGSLISPSSSSFSSLHLPTPASSDED